MNLTTTQEHHELLVNFCKECSTISDNEIKRSLTPDSKVKRIIYKDLQEIEHTIEFKLSDRILEMNSITRLIALQDAIVNAIEIHFGVRSGNLSDALIKSCITEIIDKYGTLTYPDIEFAFDRYIKQKKEDWKNPTKLDVLNPIKMWWNQKESIKYEFQRFQHEQKEKEERKAKGLEFEYNALKLYNESEFEYNGDYFQASAIAKKYFGSQLDQETKDQLWLEAKKQKKQNDDEYDKIDRDVFNLIDPNFGISAERIFCKLVLNKCLELGIEPNIFKD